MKSSTMQRNHINNYVVLAVTMFIVLLAGSLLTYALIVSNVPKEGLTTRFEVHIIVEHWRNGKLLSVTHHAGQLTDIGADWIEGQISDNAQTEQYCEYISLSDNDTAPAAGWTEIINEEDHSANLSRRAGTYASTGTGTWNLAETFTANATQAIRLYGLQWNSTAQSDNNLLCADTSTVKNLESGDTLTVTWQCSIS